MAISGVLAAGAVAKGVSDYQGAKKAGAARMSAADRAQTTQEDYLGRNTELLNPYTKFGTESLSRLGDLYGIGSGNGQPDYTAFEQSPDYQFALEQGTRAANQGLAARRMSNSGAAMKELAQFGSGLASQNLGNYKQQLMNMIGIGTQARDQQIGLNTGAAANISNIQTGKGEAQANMQQQKYGAIGNTAATLSNVATTGMGGGFKLPQQQQPIQMSAPASGNVSITGTAQNPYNSQGMYVDYN